jgi:hypothetical protein
MDDLTIHHGKRLFPSISIHGKVSSCLLTENHTVYPPFLCQVENDKVCNRAGSDLSIRKLDHPRRVYRKYREKLRRVTIPSRTRPERGKCSFNA